LKDGRSSEAHGAGGEAAGDAEQVVPVSGDEVGVDVVAGDAVEGALASIHRRS